MYYFSTCNCVRLPSWILCVCVFVLIFEETVFKIPGFFAHYLPEQYRHKIKLKLKINRIIGTN